MRTTISDVTDNADALKALAGTALTSALEKLQGTSVIPENVNQAVGTISAVQALARPLKHQESREVVCKSCVQTLKAKIVGDVEKPLDLAKSLVSLLKAKAGIVTADGDQPAGLV